jgi:hypothetical protein
MNRCLRAFTSFTHSPHSPIHPFTHSPHSPIHLIHPFTHSPHSRSVRPLYVGPTGSFGTAPNLTYAEYYLDTDPGYRQGTRLNFTTPGLSVDQTFVVDLSAVSNGFHTLFVRTRNAAGAWSITTLKPFVRSGVTATSPALSITRAEYYLDTDPGYGQGTAVAITPGTSINQTFNVDLSGTSNGFHTLFVRVMDQSRAWSLVSVKPFQRQGSIAGAARPLITRIRYQVFPKTSNVASSPARGTTCCPCPPGRPTWT